MLEEAFRDIGDGVYIKSCQNADIFTVAHFRAKTKPQNILVIELLFADDKCTNCPLSREDPDDCSCIRYCNIKVWPEDKHKTDRSVDPTELYNGQEG